MRLDHSIQKFTHVHTDNIYAVTQVFIDGAGVMKVNVDWVSNTGVHYNTNILASRYFADLESGTIKRYETRP